MYCHDKHLAGRIIEFKMRKTYGDNFNISEKESFVFTRRKALLHYAMNYESTCRKYQGVYLFILLLKRMYKYWKRLIISQDNGLQPERSVSFGVSAEEMEASKQ